MVKSISTVIVILIVIFIFLSSSFYTVSEIEQIVVTQFGRPVREVRDPGLHFKTPFIQKLTYFDKRLLDYDSAPAEIITRDKKNMVVDNYSKWRIVEPLKFLTTVHNVSGAQKRLDDIIYSELRVELGRHNLIDIVSSTRSQIMSKVTAMANKKTMEYGIEIVDVRIKRADLPSQNAKSIYERMRTERQRIAKEYRSQGEEESLKIRSQTNKERTIMLADAYRQEQIIRGEGDAEAVKIYAEALKADPDFYSFTRSLEAYKTSFKKGTTIILSTDSEFLKYFNKIKE